MQNVSSKMPLSNFHSIVLLPIEADAISLASSKMKHGVFNSVPCVEKRTKEGTATFTHYCIVQQAGKYLIALPSNRMGMSVGTKLKNLSSF